MSAVGTAAKEAASGVGSRVKQAATNTWNHTRGLGVEGGKLWSAGNELSKGFLNPTAIGAGAGMAAGGAYGGFSDNGSVLGGMAGGALLGAGGGAAFKGGQMGYNHFKVGKMTKPVGGNTGTGAEEGVFGM